MGSSPGFGSDACDLAPYSGSLSLRLRDSSPLTSPHASTRRLILQQARSRASSKKVVTSLSIALLLLVDVRFQVLFHSPLRGSFHLSLTVLCAIGHQGYLALGGGPPRFAQDSPCPTLLGTKVHRLSTHFAYGAITLSGWPSQTIRLCVHHLRESRGFPRPYPSTPVWQRPRASTPHRFRLLPFRSPLLRESNFSFFSSGY